MCLKGILAEGRTPTPRTVLQDDGTQDTHPPPPFRKVGGFGAGNGIVSDSEKYSNTHTPWMGLGYACPENMYTLQCKLQEVSGMSVWPLGSPRQFVSIVSKS
jgi:hypothetical protein